MENPLGKICNLVVTFLFIQSAMAQTQWVGGTNSSDVIYRTGRVGIGLTSPSSMLHVSESGSSHIVAIFNKNGSGMQHTRIRFQSNGTTGLEIGHENSFRDVYFNHTYGSAGKLLFKLRGNTKMAIMENGNIGIGTTTPLAKLAVNGGIRANEVRVMTNIQIADYVFEQDYTLMPLRQLEAYVQQHKHLPEIPSALEIREHGMDVAAFQNKLLQKIEELTLYIIEQEKRIQQLEAQQ